MIFEELVLENFRQFRDKQTIRFATDPKKHVTVLHGFNGAGKTTLLNAFIWALYEETTPDFEHPDHLENEASLARLSVGERMTVSVEVTFRDGDTKFIARRAFTVEKTENGGERRTPVSLVLRFVDDKGEIQTSNHPQDHVERLLPPRLYPFFFFNGERIDRLAGADAYEQIEDAVKVLLDLELFDRGVNHLESGAARRLRDEIARHSGEEGERARAEREALDEQLKQEREKLSQFERNQKALLAEKDRVDAKLASMPELASMLAERKSQEEKLEATKNSIADKKSELARAISGGAYLILTPEVLKKADEVLAAAHKKGEIPTPLKRQFVDELLEKAICICERDLKSGDPPHKAVLEWRNRVASEAVEAAATVTKAALGSLSNRRERLTASIDQSQAQREGLLRQKREVEERLSELHVKIGDRDLGEDPRKLEIRREDIQRDIDRIKLDVHDVSKSVGEIAQKLQDKDREIRNLKLADEAGKLAKRRLDAVDHVSKALSRIRRLRYDEITADLSKRLQDVWSGIAIKDYRAELGEGFQLQLTKEVAGLRQPVRGASVGEKQVVSLAFIGSLLDKARSTAIAYKGQESSRMFRGGDYALVIDSAFGQLEPDYRREVARWVTTLAPQLVVLVAEGQWRREVEEELQPMTGREYVLCCITSKKRPKDITLYGRQYQYVVQSSDGFESTLITEVEL